jgi:perosamine synthetase
MEHFSNLMIEEPMSENMIPFAKPCVTAREIEAVSSVLQSGWWTTGPKTKEFEAAFAKYLNVDDAMAVNSCTAALHLALAALGVGEGDEVLVPSMTFAASAEVAYYCGAKPVLVDVDRETHNVTVETLERKLTSKTKAVIAVHFGGVPCRIDEIAAWCQAKGLKLIEDCAHAIETKYNGRSVGTFGDVGCYSFYANKNLATGEGGMVIFKDPDALAQARILGLHGMSKDAWKRFTKAGSWKYDIIAAGFKYNLTDIASALGLVQLDRISEMAIARRAICNRYRDGLADLKGISWQADEPSGERADHLFVLRLHRLQGEQWGEYRDKVIDGLKEKGVLTSVHYMPLHRMTFYRNQGYRPEDFPNADYLGSVSLSLPLYPDLKQEDQTQIIRVLRETLG